MNGANALERRLFLFLGTSRNRSSQTSRGALNTPYFERKRPWEDESTTTPEGVQEGPAINAADGGVSHRVVGEIDTGGTLLPLLHISTCINQFTKPFFNVFGGSARPEKDSRRPHQHIETVPTEAGENHKRIWANRNKLELRMCNVGAAGGDE